MIGSASGFAFVSETSKPNTQLHMGLFDGVKNAFSAPALERSTINSERETPIDRWMGWSVTSEEKGKKAQEGTSLLFVSLLVLSLHYVAVFLQLRYFLYCIDTASKDFVDAMDSANYVTVELEKPMGIVFEENDDEFGGIFVQSLKEGGVAASNGMLKSGDQLVAVDTTKVSGMPFDDALGTIVASQAEKTKLVLFRGPAKEFYGPTGASKAWLEEFIGGDVVDASKEEASS